MTIDRKIKANNNTITRILISAIAITVAIVPLVLKHPVQASEQDLIPVCGDESPCMLDYDASQSGNNAIFKWKSGNANSYNVRYRSGGQEKQVGNTSGSFTLTNVKPNSIYKIKVQACKSRLLASSKCSDWLEMSVTTTKIPLRYTTPAER
jgi:hypothetical protein